MTKFEWFMFGVAVGPFIWAIGRALEAVLTNSLKNDSGRKP